MNLFVHLMSAVAFFILLAILLREQKERKAYLRILQALMVNDTQFFLIMSSGRIVRFMAAMVGCEPKISGKADMLIPFYPVSVFQLLASLKPSLIEYEDLDSGQSARLKIVVGSSESRPDLPKDLLGNLIKIEIVR